jgi:hypothetical protein
VSEKIQLNTRSSAQLSEEVQGVLDQEIPDPSGGIASIIGKPQTSPNQEITRENPRSHG